MTQLETNRSIQILQWSAWAPGVSTHKEWADFFQGTRTIAMVQSPDVSAVPTLLRRRMSRLSRMAVSSALDCCQLANVKPAQVRAVFASRHGEMAVTVELLEQLYAKEPVSPMAFSGSVHHTAMGYFSIASANRHAMRAVAGGEASFCYGFLDARGMLSDRGDSPVLCIAADDELPQPFKSGERLTPFPWAVAFLLGQAQPGRSGAVSLEMTGSAPFSRVRSCLNIPALEFLCWFLSNEKVLRQVLARRVWRWEK